ncbi:5-oxoprolinase subunit PxpA [Reichenbachiella ulvae]|uniref:LamB/YcsF family protein n=1 Tax=Reichenbachiella ulvae TaxID=2980104 RepID=A0ABT3CU58_9BACT|nr:5-oxoprolinase subunit PxpA [Reichenbachiella ulvae]MCV9387231.1 LamB/YcsF family protein [Reichenbachiella ulvae]
MAGQNIDINCDIGESSSEHMAGREGDLMPWVSSCNISCGFHAGDPWVIERALDMAIRRGIRIGAHPSYMDRAGFGRQEMDMDPDQLRSVIKYQVAMMKALTESKGGKLTYVKPHGALYNQASRDEEISEAIVASLIEIDSSLALMGMAGSVTEHVAKEFGVPFIKEAFIDRTYEADGYLTPRGKDNALIEDPEVALSQLRSMVDKGVVPVNGGGELTIQAESFCVHGDNEAAPKILRYIHEQMSGLGYEIKPV